MAKPPRPRSRRHGFTPQRTSENAHQESDTSAIPSIQSLSGTSIGTVQRTRTAARKIHIGGLGTWATVIDPVRRFRKNQSKVVRDEAQFAFVALGCCASVRCRSSAIEMDHCTSLPRSCAGSIRARGSDEDASRAGDLGSLRRRPRPRALVAANRILVLDCRAPQAPKSP